MEIGDVARELNRLSLHGVRKGPLPLRAEQVRRVRVLPVQSPQGPDLRSP